MSNNLLLLHGALGQKGQFEKLQKLLSANFQVYTLDFSGHGSNVSDKEFSMESFKDDVLDFMGANLLKKTHIFGYSMGGYVALKLALDFPEKIEKIMTLGTKINWNPETAAKELKMLDPEKMELKVPKFAENLQKVHTPNDWKMVVNKTARMIRGLGEEQPLKLENIRQISTPVLACIGSEDILVTKEETQHLSDDLMHGKFLEIEGFEHSIDRVDFQKLSEFMLRYFLNPEKHH